jgi:catechol 2,3-dioxygenase-like lactoylglutathione lyase family enzyme
VAEHLWDQVKVEADVSHRHVDVVEAQPPWDGFGEHTRFPIARLRYTNATGLWAMYCAIANVLVTLVGVVVAVPILRVSNVDRSVAWWQRLGFTEEFRHRFDEGLPSFVGVVRNDCRVYLSEHRGDAPGPALVYLWVPDVDTVAAAFGVPVDDMPWARDCEIVDPDGNRVRVASQRPVEG